MRKYTVIVEWSGKTDELDADEVVVFAVSSAEAESKARRQWRMTVGMRWPHLQIDRVWSLRKAQRSRAELT
jgi:hypothetical protein